MAADVPDSDMTARLPDEARRSNRLLLVKLGIVVVVMFGFGFALVPFYDQICRATGIRDIGRPDEVANTQIDATRSVRLELDANTIKLPWRFRPLTPVVSVHPGEVTQVVYEVENLSERTVTSQAVPSYGPPLAGEYFRKLECFCFTRQALAPHEKRTMPVLFVVDPKLPLDVATITLSYTFFEVEGNAVGQSRFSGRPDFPRRFADGAQAKIDSDPARETRSR